MLWRGKASNEILTSEFGHAWRPCRRRLDSGLAGEEGISVRVPDDVLKCVGFIGEVEHQDSSGVSGELRATGFFVAIPCESPQLNEMRTCYFVTARHVATEFEGRTAYFLVNAKGGGVVGITGVVGEHWFLHPSDTSADVAAIQILMDSQADINAIALEHFGLPERLDLDPS